MYDKLQGRIAAAVTPSDTDNIPNPANAAIKNLGNVLFVGTGGDIKVFMANDSVPILFKNIPDGTFLPIQVTRVFATDTTATDIVAIW